MYLYQTLENVLHTDVELAVRVVREHGVHQADIQTDLSAVVCDAEHIVLGGIHRAGVDAGGTFAQLLHHLLLEVGRLCHHGLKLCLRHRQMKLVTGFNVRNLLEHGHQFREVKELGKSGAGTVACTFGG